jgi:hypothetical protein
MFIELNVGIYLLVVISGLSFRRRRGNFFASRPRCAIFGPHRAREEIMRQKSQRSDGKVAHGEAAARNSRDC